MEVLKVDELEQDVLSRDRFNQFLGSVAVNNLVKVPEVNEDIESSTLDRTIEMARLGDPASVASIYANVKSAVIEAIYKTCHITRVKTEVDPSGAIKQFGRSMIEVNRNALLHSNKLPAFMNRLRAEALNTHRIEDLIRTQILNDYWFFTPSLYPDDMTDDEAQRSGFFVKSKTDVLQAFTVEADEGVIESAFLNLNPSVIKEFYSSLGYDVSKLSVTELLASPLLIHKSMMPNGVVDIVKLLDQIDGNSFFGQKGMAIDDYQKQRELCDLRERNLEVTSLAVFNDLIWSSNTNSPEAAARTLHKAVKNRIVKYAGNDTSIDASIFGPDAENFINQARYLMASGNQDLADELLNRAIEKAIVTICGMGDGINGENNNSDPTTETDSEDLPKHVKCINCRKLVDTKSVVKEKSWCCPKCKYEVDICSGKILNGGSVSSNEPKVELKPATVTAKQIELTAIKEDKKAA